MGEQVAPLNGNLKGSEVQMNAVAKEISSESASQPRWYRVKNLRTKIIYYARSGFGEMIAICDPRDRYCTGWRFTKEFCRENYVVLGVCPDSDEFESRFQYELHR